MVNFGYKQINRDRTPFVKQRSKKIIALIVYVHDIIITRNDVEETASLKIQLPKEFETKELRQLIYFIGIRWQNQKKELCYHNRSM